MDDVEVDGIADVVIPMEIEVDTVTDANNLPDEENREATSEDQEDSKMAGVVLPKGEVSDANHVLAKEDVMASVVVFPKGEVSGANHVLAKGDVLNNAESSVNNVANVPSVKEVDTDTKPVLVKKERWNNEAPNVTDIREVTVSESISDSADEVPLPKEFMHANSMPANTVSAGEEGNNEELVDHLEWLEKQQPQSSSSRTPTEVEAEVDDEELGVAETYANYEPVKLKYGKSHPDQIVESSSLASVQPTEIWYELSLPMSTINDGALSALQLEAIVYAAQQHERILLDGSRAGFLLGDGTGVGKGRTVAGIIFENYLKNRKKAIWVSVSSDLKYDCERDLKDVGASRIKVYALNKMDYVKIDSYHNGYVREGVIYSTYSSLIGRTGSSKATCRSRVDQLLQWCGEDFDGPIIFDESHRAKNLYTGRTQKPTKTAMTVLQLQRQLPKARIVYVSATGASEIKNMAYMARLGLWGLGTSFPYFQDFIKAIEKRGVGAMEIVAIDMKLRGMYIARQLSFQGVTFRIEEVPLDEKFIEMYNDSVDLMIELKDRLTEALAPLDEKDEEDDEDEDDDEQQDDETRRRKKLRKVVWCQYWAMHQRFFKYLCIASKVKQTVELAKAAIEDGKCVVIGLLTTGEAQTMNQLEYDEGELTDFISTAKGVLQNFVKNHYPSPEEVLPKNSKKAKTSWDSMIESDLSDSGASDSSIDSDEILWEGLSYTKRPADKKTGKAPAKRAKVDAPVKSRRSKDAEPSEDPVKRELLEKIEVLGKRLPANTLDQLIDELGGPDKVAEMTGRKGRVVRSNGYVEYESRAGVDASLENQNLVEKQKFMDGDKNIVIISEAASSGISLHSDKRAKNQRRRVHITLEMPWSADKAMQQFGRTHRSNQANAPEYVFLISDLAGERRFASIVAKHLESLGALTHGDRRATETRDLSRFNVYNKYGRSALTKTIRGVSGLDRAFLPAPADYPGAFFSDATKALTSVGMFKTKRAGILELDTEATHLTRFLNRLLGLKVDMQNRLFKYFNDVLHTLIAQAKKEGKFDLGILDLGSSGEDVKRIKTFSFSQNLLAGIATTQLHIFHVERGMSWELAYAKYAELSGPNEGFYLQRHSWRNDRLIIILAIHSPLVGCAATGSDGSRLRDTYTVYRPNIGLQPRKMTLADLTTGYVNVAASVAENYWKEHYSISENTCTHAFWNGVCRNVKVGIRCETGTRKRTYTVLSGSILNIWTKIEETLAARGSDIKLKVIRLKTADGCRMIGTIIPNSCAGTLKMELASVSINTTEETLLEGYDIHMPLMDEIPLSQSKNRAKKAPTKKAARRKNAYKKPAKYWRRRF